MRAFATAVAGIVLATAVAQTAGAGEGLDWESRRDPFDYHTATPRKTVIDGGKVDGSTTRVRPRVDHLDPTKILAEAGDLLGKVDDLLEEREYLRARDMTHGVLADMRKAGLDQRDEFERITRYHQTATRLHRRVAIEAYLTKKNITLQGIVWDEVSPVVLIGGKMLREGDMIEDVTIESIGRSEVILVKDGVRVRRAM
jgi:hypothetical protein